MPMTYDEFRASDLYFQAIPGAAMRVRLTSEQDSSIVLVGTSSLSVRATVEQIEIEEGGNDGPTEIVTGAWKGRINGSIYATSYRIDAGAMLTRTPSAAPVLTSTLSWTVEVFDGPRFPGAVAASPKDRVRWAARGLRLGDSDTNTGARGDVRMSIDGPFLYLYNGAQWAAENSS